MNSKVTAAFISFAILLAVWIGLAEAAKTELSDLLVFVKGATITAWTAAALFFETADNSVATKNNPPSVQKVTESQSILTPITKTEQEPTA